MFTAIKNFPKNLIRGLKWFKRGYANYDWDQAYLLYIIDYKLNDMRKFWINPKNIHIIESTRLKICFDIITCCDCLRRLSKDDYQSQEFDDYFEKWGNFTRKDLPDGSSILGEYENVKTDEDKKSCNAEFKAISKKALELKEKDKELFFNTFKNNYEFWWD